MRGIFSGSPQTVQLENGSYGLNGYDQGTGGAMLYVVFGETLPQSILMYHSKMPAFTAIAGILVGILVIFI